MDDTILTQDDIDSIIEGLNGNNQKASGENWFLSAWRNYEKERERKIESIDRIVKERDDAIEFQSNILDRIEHALLENPVLKTHSALIKGVIQQARSAAAYNRERITDAA